MQCVLSLAIRTWIFALGFAGCFHQEEPMHTVRYRYQFPATLMQHENTPEVHVVEDTIFISYWKDFVLYRLPATTDFVTGKQIAGTYEYFLLRKDKSHGYLFRGLDSSRLPEKWPVDSFLTQKAAQGKPFERPSDSIWKLVDSTVNKDEIIERYALLEPSKALFDSIYYSYRKGFQFEHSFSRQLDEEHGMKLFRIQMIQNAEYSDNAQLKLPRREFLFELMPADLPETTPSLIDFIRKHEKLFQ